MSGLVRSNLLVASGTAISRITGLARIIVFASIIGQTSVADIFEIANNAPNAVYELLIGGVLSASLVPLVVSIIRRDATASHHRDLDAVYSTSLVLLAAVTAMAVLGGGWIFRIFTLSPSTDVDVAAFRSAGTLLTRIFVVQIFFYGITALSSAVLNARGRFTMGAWSPALANLITIGILFLVPLTGADNPPSIANISSMSATTWTLGLSTTLGIAVMAFVQWATMHRAGIRISFRPSFSNDSVRELLRLSTWSVGYVLANQIALVVIKNLATPGSGLVDAYTKAYVIFQLPHGLLAVSIATTFLPRLAEKHRAGRDEEFAGRISQGIRATILLTLPASIGAVVLAEPLVTLLLGHGNFDLAAIESTSRALSGLAIGLVGFSTYLFVLRGFYAKGDTRTPFFINLAENAINIALAIALVDSLDVFGLGVAFAIAYLAGAVIAAVVLAATTPLWSIAHMVRPIGRYLVAGSAMSLVTWATSRSLQADGALQSLATVLLAGAAGTAAYLVVLVVMRDEDLRHGARLYLERKTTKSSR
jgi:putative peptidoglycan lipid II flippase